MEDLFIVYANDLLRDDVNNFHKIFRAMKHIYEVTFDKIAGYTDEEKYKAYSEGIEIGCPNTIAFFDRFLD